MFIDDDVGIFISLNSTGTVDDVRSNIFRGFRERYFLGEIAPPSIAPLSATAARRQAQAMAGDYRTNRSSVNNPTVLGRLLMQTRIVAAADGALEPKTLLDQNPDVWLPVGKFLWRHIKGEDYLRAELMNGKVTGFVTRSSAPFVRFEQVRPWHGATVILPLVMLACSVLIVASTGGPLAQVSKRLLKRPATAIRWRREGALWIASSTAALVMIVWIGTLALFQAELLPANETIDTWMLTLRIGGSFALIVSCAVCWGVVAVLRADTNFIGRLSAATLALATTITVYAGIAFGLFGWDTQF